MRFEDISMSVWLISTQNFQTVKLYLQKVFSKIFWSFHSYAEISIGFYKNNYDGQNF